MAEWSQERRWSSNRLRKSRFWKQGLGSMVYSVGGLELPAGDATAKETRCANEWVKDEKSYQAYFMGLRGSLFVIGFFGLIIICLTNFFMKSLWFREPILIVIIVWFFLYLAAVVYYNPDAVMAYAPAQVPLVWAFFAITLKNVKQKRMCLYLIVFLPIIVWNNWCVIQFFKSKYSV